MSPALSLTEVCKREEERVELVEIFEYLEFFLIIEKERIWYNMQIFEILPGGYVAG